ncbi:DUF4157 domain-containing protein [Tumidithrix elongata RA019]|uniref:DUF4157 domain-containing protein n=1 Tax=Tumidithrix elongata BACA0141 TaxID=2716417 RepID=A0AAW9Q9N9_9CYAN|nr:DUF4157 domain-containing protein [Tumidithrix elongata RA019]
MGRYRTSAKKQARQDRESQPSFTVKTLQMRPFAPPQESQAQPHAEDRTAEMGHRLENISFQPRPQANVMARKWEGIRAAYQAKQVQAKLAIGAVGDKYEQEADQVASQVVQTINTPENVQREDEEQVQTKPLESIQREEAPEEEDEELQMKPLSDSIQRDEAPEEEELQMKPMLQRREAVNGGDASEELESSIQQAKGSGQPLDPNLQEKMGQAMGADFSSVKVHTDSQSDQLNQSIQARAFTTGQDVFFRKGSYNPSSTDGQELIAHELTHVVQQNGNNVQKKTDACKIQRNSVKEKIAFFESWAKDNQKTSGSLPTQTPATGSQTLLPVSGGGAKSVAALDPSVAPKNNKEIVKYFLLKERSDDYIDEDKDSSKFVFEKVFGTTKEDFLKLPKPDAEKKLKNIGWTNEEIEDFLKTAKTEVKYLETEESRADYELQGGSTLTQGKPPNPFDTTAMFAHGFGKGHGIYVMSPDGKLYTPTKSVSSIIPPSLQDYQLPLLGR